MSRLFTFRNRASWLALFAVAAFYLGLSALAAWASHGDITPHVSINDVTELEGDTGTDAFEFTVSLDAPPTQDVEVDFITSDDTAEDENGDGDYQSNSGTVTFSSSTLNPETSKTITVQVNGDTIDETDESFRVVLIAARNAHISDDVGVGAIQNDDDPDITIDDPSVLEGDSGTSDLVFTVTLSNAADETITVDYATADGTATTADSDYTDTSGTLTWAAGDDTVRTVTVPVNGDTVDEPDEDLMVGLTVTGGSTGSVDGEGTGTIDNDDDPTIAIDDVAVTEGDTGTVDAVFNVTLSNPSDVDVTVNFATSDGTATASPDLMPNTEDYESTSGNVTFSGGSTEETISVPVNGDTQDEADEDFFVDLADATGGATIDDGQGVGTIVNDDARVSIGDASVGEGDSGTTIATFTVSLSRASSSGPVSVDFASADGTATIGDGDYDATSGTLTWAQDDNADKTVEVVVNGDTTDEADETFTVDLTNISGDAKIGDGEGTGTIVNDDDPTIDIDDVTELETDGTTTFSFTVSLSNPSNVDVTVDYATSDGTATASTSGPVPPATTGDYEPDDGTVTFTPGDISETIDITVNGDNDDEPDEDFFVDLADATGGASIDDGQGVGTIVNDDARVSIGDASVGEGDSGTTMATFTVSLSRASSSGPVSVEYATANGTATTGDGDYDATSGTLTWAQGDDADKTVEVTVNGDTTDEANETFTVVLDNLSGDAKLGDTTGEGTIVNDDDPTLSIGDATVLEGDGGTVDAVFTVTISNPSNEQVTVDVDTADDTATTADGDYGAVNTTLTWSANDGASKTVTVPVTGDTADEADEDFFVDLNNATGGATISDGRGVGTITDDDEPAVSVDDPSVTEGDAGTADLVFTVTLDIAGDETVTVDYATADNTATTADGDYEATGGTLTFTPGDTSEQVTVTVNGDDNVEGDETLFLNLSNATGGATIADGQGVGTIAEDAGEGPTLSIGDVTVTEGDTGTVDASFTVSLSGRSDQPVTFDWGSGNGTATTANGDYASSGNTGETIPAGDTSTTVTVPVNGDEVDEEDEYFFVFVTSVNGANAGDTTGRGDITNDDDPSISIDDVSVGEGDSGTTTATFTVSLSNESDEDVTVGYTTADGTATTADGDYDATSGTLTFTGTETSKTVAVTVNGDVRDEPDEVFTVELSNATGGANIADGTGEGTITDDDDAPGISVDDPSTVEGDSGTTALDFTVTLSEASGKTVTVDYATADGSAQDENGDGDYQSDSGTLTFAPGETSKTVPVTVNGDTLHEDDETFDLNLSTPSNATIADGTGTGTITNDDDPPSISIDDPSVLEGDSGTRPLDFTVTLSEASGKTVTVDYATVDGTATTADGDYDAASGALTFAPGETSKTVPVTVNGDTVDETDETFDANLSNPTGGATIADGTGTGTIVNDDDPPSISIDDPSVLEGDSGTRPLDFTVTLSNPSSQSVTVDYATADGTAEDENGDGDYQSDSGTLTFAPRETSKTVPVTINGDTVDETDETFDVNLSNPTGGATIADGTGTGTIVNDDDPSVSIGDVSVGEGDSGPTTATFTVSLSNESDEDVTVDYTTADGTATIADGDYDATSGQLTFAGGDMSEEVVVTVNGDVRDETDELFTVELANATGGASIGDGTGEGTITDDDDAPGISVDDPSVAEGDSGTTTLDFTVTLSEASGKSVTVDYATADGTAGDENGAGDYQSDSGTLTFAPGETSKAVPVTVNGDTVDEPDETLDVALSNPGNATITTATGTGTIVDDDEAVTPDPDSDDDGVADESDNCPDVANEGQADADGDGRGDACDPDYEATDVGTTDRPDSTQQTGDRACMTFQAEDDAGQPVEGAELIVQLSGANSEEDISVGCGFTAQSTESDTTDANGEATFSYVGNDEGRDTIFAFVDRDGDGQWDGDEPFSSPFSITWESQQTGDGGTTVRLSGADRWKTAIDISQNAYPGSDSVSTVVLARGDSPNGYADALAGAPLAASLDAPLLITAPGVLLDDVATEIDRVLADGGEVIMLGQTAALSSDVEQAIVAMGYDARRIGGVNRFETSTMIAEEVDATPDQILIARAFDFPDALTAGAAASAGTGRVVILGSAGGRHAATEAYLNDHPGAQRYAIGGQMAAVYPEATPVFGADRFKTATAVADRFFTDPISAGIARSHDFPDSLTGGPYVGTRGGPMLLTPDAAFVAGSGEELRAETRQYLCDNSTSIEDAFVFGGTAAIADATETEVGQAIRGEDC